MPECRHDQTTLAMHDYLAAADEEVLCIVTIAHTDAVARIEEIVGTPGIDLAFIGPADLATSLGLRGQVARAQAGIRASAVVLGGGARTAEQANAMVKRGDRALVLGFDWSLLQRGIAASLEGIRRGRLPRPKRSGISHTAVLAADRSR